MRKNLKLIACMIVLCVVSVLNVKVMLGTERSGDLAMTSLAAIGKGKSIEGGSGESGDKQDPCYTSTTGDVTMQDCRGITMYARVTITYTCEGKDLGVCEDGVEYYYYDCEGEMIKHSEDIALKSCGK